MTDTIQQDAQCAPAGESFAPLEPGVSTTCIQCGTRQPSHNDFCTTCGSGLAASAACQAVTIHELVSSPFDCSTRVFWKRAAAAAVFGLPGLAFFGFAIAAGIHSTGLLATCVVAAAPATLYILYLMQRRDCPASTNSLSASTIAAGILITAMLYAPALLLGSLFFSLTASYLGVTLGILFAPAPYMIFVLTAAATCACLVHLYSRPAAQVLNEIAKTWHRFCAVSLFAAAYAAGALPICLVVAAFPRAFARESSNAWKTFIAPLRQIALRLPVPDTTDVSEGSGAAAKLRLIKSVAAGIVIRFPAALIAYWYALAAVASALIGHACHGQSITFDHATTQCPQEGEYAHVQMD